MGYLGVHRTLFSRLAQYLARQPRGASKRVSGYTVGDVLCVRTRPRNPSHFDSDHFIFFSSTITVTVCLCSFILPRAVDEDASDRLLLKLSSTYSVLPLWLL